MMTKADTAFARLLIDKNIASEAVLGPFIDAANKGKETLYALLLKSGQFPEETILKNFSEATKIPLVELSLQKPTPAVVEKVPLKIAEYYKLVPLKIEGRKLTIAVSSLLDLRTQDDIRAHLGYEVETVLAREKEVVEAIKRFYGFAAGTISEMISASTEPGSTPAAAEKSYDAIDNIEKMAGDASIAKLVNQIILEAYHKRATDIHIEPYRGKVKLRYRIDGNLYNANVQTEISRFILPILSRIKIIANLNIVEKRLPQDGRAIVKVEDTTLDLRVSCIPTSYGESVVIRMLPMNRIFSLSQLGLGQKETALFQSMIQKPHGIIFITGPTGSGKSTTLYACLSQLNSDDRKIITIEDPVEYEMDGITQIQVTSAIGLDFARGLRSILRHDPDVIMVGEVRDLETAETAIRVALTGHLVFSTLHTNDSASSVTRLVDIGVEPYLVASSVEAFIAQRLVRVICSNCKEEDKNPAQLEIKKLIANEMNLKADQISLFLGRGCNQCNNAGFWGRIAIYEVLLMTEKVKDLVMKKAPADELKKMAMMQGMKTLRQDGWEKVLAGITTPEEILKVAPLDKEDSLPAHVSLPDTEESKPAKKKVLPDTADERHSDRRIFMRLHDSVNIRYRIVKSKDSLKKTPGLEEFTVSRNISAGGLLFVTKESIPLSSIVELKIELPNESTPVECLARVMREEEKANESIYEIAVCFLDLSGSQRARLDKYVEVSEEGE